MRCVGVARVALFSLGTVAGLVIQPMVALAASTDIQTQICNSALGSPAWVAITRPANDSLVNSGQMALEGGVSGVNQIDVLIDGNYDQTVSIAAGQSSFATTISMTKGTHTIRITASDSCGFSTVSDAAVVTYRPDGPPSNGAATPTTVGQPDGGSSTGSGLTIDNAQPGVARPVSPKPVNPFVAGMIRSLDFDTMPRDGLGTALGRSALFLLGIGLLLAGPPLVAALEHRRMVGEAFARYVQKSKPMSRIASHLRRNTVTVRLLGLLSVIGAFIV